MLDVPAPTMLDLPAPTMLDLPARQSPTLDVPAHLANTICSNTLPLWTPTTLEVPAPDTQLMAVFRTSIATEVKPLQPPCFIAFEPSNPHDPGPKVGGSRVSSTLHRRVVLPLLPSYPSIIISAFLITSSITFSTITQFATHDYLCIPARSPQCLYVMCCL